MAHRHADRLGGQALSGRCRRIHNIPYQLEARRRFSFYRLTEKDSFLTVTTYRRSLAIFY